MKRISSISFAVLYILTTVGLTVNIHYCGGKLKNINLLGQASKCCCGDTKSMDGCCDDETFYVQLDEDHQISQIQDLQLKIPVPTFTTDTEFVEFETNEDEIRKLTRNKAPPNSPLRLLFCSLTFYG